MFEPSFIVYNRITGRYSTAPQLGFMPDPPKEVINKARKEFFEKTDWMGRGMSEESREAIRKSLKEAGGGLIRFKGKYKQYGD